MISVGQIVRETSFDRGHEMLHNGNLDEQAIEEIQKLQEKIVKEAEKLAKLSQQLEDVLSTAEFMSEYRASKNDKSAWRKNR